jgi:hypothetical protein
MTEAKNGSFRKEKKKAGLAGDLAGDHVAKKCANVAKMKIVGDIAGELTGDIAGDNIANILYNCSKIIEKLYQKNILM